MYPHYFSLRCYCCRPLLESNKTTRRSDGRQQEQRIKWTKKI